MSSSARFALRAKFQKRMAGVQKSAGLSAEQSGTFLDAMRQALDDGYRFGYGAGGREKWTLQDGCMVYSLDCSAQTLNAASSGSTQLWGDSVKMTLNSPKNIRDSKAFFIADRRMVLFGADTPTGGSVDGSLNDISRATKMLAIHLGTEGTNRATMLGTTFPCFDMNNIISFDTLEPTANTADQWLQPHDWDSYEQLPESVLLGVNGYDDDVYVVNMSDANVTLPNNATMLVVFAGKLVEFHHTSDYDAAVRMIVEGGFVR